MKERCEDCKGLEEEIYWKHFQSMQFCQFLTGDFHSQLMIPEKFSEKLGEKLSQKLGLRGPSGTNWDVQLVKSGDVLYLGNGWENFVDAHSLAEKDILIFKYTGNSQFDVLMFEGSNLCEKESSYFIRKCGHTKKTEDGSKTPRTALKDFVSTPVENAGKPKDAFEKQNSHFSEKENSMKKASDDEPEFACAKDELSQNPSQVWEPVKLPGSKQIPMREGKSTAYQNFHFNDRENDMKKASDDEPEFAGAEDEFSQNPSQIWEPVKLPGSKEMTMREGKSKTYYVSYASNRRPVTEAEKVAAMRLASKELSEGSFLVAMRSTHVSKRFYMNLPSDWAMANAVQERQDVILRTKERSWKTSLIFNAARRGGLSRGWRDFAIDNNLEEFDVCVFKLVSQKQKPVVLDVSIFRVVPEVAPQTRLTLEPSSSSQGASAVNKRKFSQLENDVQHI